MSAQVYRNNDGSARVINAAGNWRVWKSLLGWIAVNDGPGDRTIFDGDDKTRTFATADEAIDHLKSM
ncbi:hypothetical protein ACFFX1_55120 [Dactylosporangium sucinum]|uniref:Uncharacterized protein n=1 Tax=Dactylosporangium sucinum TaxID=1424081 RepID=A0A917U3V1_9ACTN|nr:hypothetical protein [Dactylosporangium sucinum]GGM53037.1 hypothetical protein GCM10007977_063360 [Dactylosporangium sucinum]